MTKMVRRRRSQWDLTRREMRINWDRQISVPLLLSRSAANLAGCQVDILDC